MSPSAPPPSSMLGERKLEESDSRNKKEPKSSSSSTSSLQLRSNNNTNKNIATNNNNTNNNKHIRAKGKRKRPAHSPFASLFLMALEKRPSLRLLLGNMKKTLVSVDQSDHQPSGEHITCIENANAFGDGNSNDTSQSQSRPIHNHTTSTTEKDLTQQQKETLFLDRLEETLVDTTVTITSETTSECHSMADDDDDYKHLEDEEDKQSSSVDTEMEEDDYVPNSALKAALQTAKRDMECIKTELEEAIKSSLDYEWKHSDQQEKLDKVQWQNTCLQKQLEASKRLSQLEAVLEINMEETWDLLTVQEHAILLARQQNENFAQQLENCQKTCLDWDWKYSDQQEELKLVRQEKGLLQQRLLKKTQQQQQQQKESKTREIALELQQQPWRVVPSPSPHSSSNIIVNNNSNNSNNPTSNNNNNNNTSDASEIKKQLDAATKQCLDLDWRLTDQQEELLSTKQALEEAKRQLAEQATTRL